MVTLDNTDISPVLDRVLAATGVDFSLYRESTLRRRISRRMVASHCTDLLDYLYRLDTDSEEIGLLRRDLTIKWTEFFRDPEVFGVIRAQVLPAIVADHSKSREPVAVWSAGCATGEEVYSLAASFRMLDKFGDSAIGAAILGTDVDPAAVESAAQGVYKKHPLSKTPDNCPSGWFTDDGRCICVEESLRALTSFGVHDLTSIEAGAALDTIRPGMFDLILCRNVLVYLQRPTQARVLELCCSKLKLGGYLVLGAKETVPTELQNRLRPHNPPLRIFRRAGEEFIAAM